MRWQLSNRADPLARQIADRHYNRQKVGADQFVPPGRCVVLVIPGHAFWVTSWPYPEYVKHAWAGAWMCSAFRNETPPGLEHPLHLSSELVLEAIAATRYCYPDVGGIPEWVPPPLGMVTFVDPRKTKNKRDPGRCFRKAGFRYVGRTIDQDLVALQLPRHLIPDPEAPLGINLALAI